MAKLLELGHLRSIIDKVKSLVFGTSNIADNAITTPKIADTNVTYNKLNEDVIKTFNHTYASGDAVYYIPEARGARWIRILSTTNYASSGIISLYNNYSAKINGSVQFTFNIHSTDPSTSNITQFGGNNNIFRKVRIVKETGYIYHIEVYYNQTELGNHVYIALSNNIQCYLLTTPIDGFIPEGGAAKEFEFTDGMAANNFKGNLNGTADNAWYINRTNTENKLNTSTYGDFAGIIQSPHRTDIPSVETITGGEAWYNIFKILHNNSDGWYTELAMPFYSERGIYYRTMSSGNIYPWRRIPFADEKIDTAATADTVVDGAITPAKMSTDAKLTNFALTGVNNNQLSITSADVTKTANLTTDARYGQRYFNKSDNGGHTKLILISEIPANFSTAKGFQGRIIELRDGGYPNNYNVDIICYSSYSDDGICLYTSNSNFIPCIVRYNNKLYSSISIKHGGSRLIFEGYFINCLDNFIELLSSSNDSLPAIDGVEYLYTDRIHNYFDYNAYSAQIANTVTNGAVTTPKLADKSVTTAKLADEVNTTINNNINTAIANVVANAPQDFDTLKEIADWIADHPEDTTAMNTQITQNKNDIAALSDEMPKVKIFNLDAITNDDYSSIINWVSRKYNNNADQTVLFIKNDITYHIRAYSLGATMGGSFISTDFELTHDTNEFNRLIIYSDRCNIDTLSGNNLITDGGITENKLASNAVTTDKIAANAVTTDKIKDTSITTNKIANNAITNNKIANGAVNSSNLSYGAKFTKFTINSTYNELSATAQDVTRRVSLEPHAYYGSKTFTKSNNVNNSLFLISELPDKLEPDSSTETGSAVHMTYGVVGTIYTVNENYSTVAHDNIIDVICKIKPNNASGYIREFYTSNRKCVPVLIKKDNKYYLALSVSGSATEVTLKGYLYNTEETFTELQGTDTNYLTPIEGVEYLHTDDINLYADDNVSHAEIAETANTVPDNSITSSKIADGAITPPKIPNYSINRYKLTTDVKNIIDKVDKQHNNVLYIFATGLYLNKNSVSFSKGNIYKRENNSFVNATDNDISNIKYNATTTFVLGTSSDLIGTWMIFTPNVTEFTSTGYFNCNGTIQYPKVISGHIYMQYHKFNISFNFGNKYGSDFRGGSISNNRIYQFTIHINTTENTISHNYENNFAFDIGSVINNSYYYYGGVLIIIDGTIKCMSDSYYAPAGGNIVYISASYLKHDTLQKHILNIAINITDYSSTFTSKVIDYSKFVTT